MLSLDVFLLFESPSIAKCESIRGYDNNNQKCNFKFYLGSYR